ncbi:hypothetical protein HD597_009861 [Nonomuraea thailandensis]|uniref:Uncharacterized protein n=1 Tax=Nonomuraea thailandensis TaxID=1188745 RepID=A0A9X2GPL4_9ACTN|nr:hypothetical protein [Nonomuraea thailandensis]
MSGRDAGVARAQGTSPRRRRRRAAGGMGKHGARGRRGGGAERDAHRGAQAREPSEEGRGPDAEVRGPDEEGRGPRGEGGREGRALGGEDAGRAERREQARASAPGWGLGVEGSGSLARMGAGLAWRYKGRKARSNMRRAGRGRTCVCCRAWRGQNAGAVRPGARRSVGGAGAGRGAERPETWRGGARARHGGACRQGHRLELKEGTAQGRGSASPKLGCGEASVEGRRRGGSAQEPAREEGPARERQRTRGSAGGQRGGSAGGQRGGSTGQPAREAVREEGPGRERQRTRGSAGTSADGTPVRRSAAPAPETPQHPTTDGTRQAGRGPEKGRPPPGGRAGVA